MDCILPSDALTFADSRRLPRLFTLNTTKTYLKKQSQTPPDKPKKHLQTAQFRPQRPNRL